MANFDLATVNNPGEVLAGGPPHPTAGLPSREAVPAAPVRDSLPAEPERPIIEISTEEHMINDQAIAALASDPDLFQRNHMLVRVLRAGPKPSDLETGRDPGTPVITPLHPATLRERLAKHAIWAIKMRTETEWTLVPVHPPDWSTRAIMQRGHWDSVRCLMGVTEVPLFLADGRILDPGYDHRSGLLHLPEIEYPKVPANPSLEAASLAARALLALVSDFPFKGDDETHKVAWLSALLTVLARPAIHGPTPMFLFDSNQARTGKSLLADLVSLIGCGRCAGRTTYPSSEEEMGKALLAIALGGVRLLLLDNREIGREIGGAALDAAITSQTISGRILGLSKFVTDVPFSAIVVATGNNLTLTADTADRVIIARLESTVEKPAERDQWQIPGLLEFVRKRRGPLASAALTILKGYHCAGRPVPDPKPAAMGGFESWCSLVRNAVIWVTNADPCATRGIAKAVDATAVALPSLIEGWIKLCEDCGAESITVAQALKTLAENPGIHSDLHNALCETTRDGKLPSPQALGNTLGRVRGRVVAGKALDRTEVHGAHRWFVRTLHPSR